MKVGGVELAVREPGRGPTFLWGHGLLSSMAQDVRRWPDLVHGFLTTATVDSDRRKRTR